MMPTLSPSIPQLQTQYVERGTFVEQVAQLQRALTSCQLAADRREAAHKKIRADLEREVAELKAALAGQQVSTGGRTGIEQWEGSRVIVSCMRDV